MHTAELETTTIIPQEPSDRDLHQNGGKNGEIKELHHKDLEPDIDETEIRNSELPTSEEYKAYAEILREKLLSE
jgi:hypothetical protein